MVLPLILAIGGRVALSAVLRLIARNRAAAIAKYGVKAVNKAVKMGKNYKGKDKSVLQAIKKVTKTTKKPFKVKFKAKTKKQIAIQKKIITKYKKPTKVKTKPTKKVTTAKPKVKVKTKPTKKVTTAKPKKIKTKPTKKVITVKPKKFKPRFWTGVTVGGAAVTLLDLLKKKKKAPPLKPGIDKDKDKIIPKIKPEKVREKPGPQSGPTVKKKLEPRFLRVPLKSGPTIKKKFTEERAKSFENRVRTLVAQKDRLKNIEAGGGRSEYQVRMHKLKLENKKAWKKLFTIGGKLK